MGKKNESKSDQGHSKKGGDKVAKVAKSDKTIKAETKAKAPKVSKAAKTKDKVEEKAAPVMAEPIALPTKPRAAKSQSIPMADIELRAYFVAEKRHREGRPGDAHSDWLEAERQLKQERSAKGAASPASAAKPKSDVKKTVRKSVK